MSIPTAGDTVAAATAPAPAVAGSRSSSTINSNDRNCLVSLTLFYGSFLCLFLVMVIPWLSPVPVLLQMGLYTAPILYVGSHLSLKQNEVDATTGEKLNKGEAMNRTDAMLFPVFGSIALFSLYLAYKFLGTVWVNMLLTLYLTGVGLLALGETTFAVAAIALVSVGSFGVASILLCGLFVYDVIWVFGTEVMVSVAKAFEGPAKLMFPVQISPLQYSILGLGDVVIPGVLIAMCLRFDLFLHLKQQSSAAQTLAVDIHQASLLGCDLAFALLAYILTLCFLFLRGFEFLRRFPKFYFCVVLSFYELGLLTTGIVMLYAQHPQPALLYLVPYCLFSLFGAAALNGKIKDVLAYKEEEEAEKSITCPSASEQADKKEN
ncbi:signal peptide peptidase domain-containing protein, putative [Eimeria praecox]|uniref:Signal peptide peptidase domain-containing protein, putative n=1 Tax=Eimeria praecox TaxID=51316 RepID=U6GPR6_9EIME|nr:signal peptide peptidase domain-containing protein, putative [Eimeria praecox]